MLSNSLRIPLLHFLYQVGGKEGPLDESKNLKSKGLYHQVIIKSTAELYYGSATLEWQVLSTAQRAEDGCSHHALPLTNSLPLEIHNLGKS